LSEAERLIFTWRHGITWYFRANYGSLCCKV